MAERLDLPLDDGTLAELAKKLALRDAIEAEAAALAATNTTAHVMVARGTAAAPQKQADKAILHHGNSCYSADGGGTIAVTANEDQVLRSFLDRQAMTNDELVRLTGIDRAAAVLRDLEKKYAGVFARYITLPGGKGKGGYAVRIRDAT